MSKENNNSDNELASSYRDLARKLEETRNRLSKIEDRAFKNTRLNLQIEKLRQEIRLRDEKILDLEYTELTRKLEPAGTRSSVNVSGADLAGLDLGLSQAAVSDRRERGTLMNQGVEPADNTLSEHDDPPFETETPVVAKNNWHQLEKAIPDSYKPEKVCSVIIPCYNNQDALDRTLVWLSKQTYPAKLIEIIVVDDGSEIPVTIHDDVELQDVRIVRRERSGFRLAVARNLGAADARGEILFFLDADVLPHPEWIASHAAWHHIYPRAVTTGRRFALPPSEVINPLPGADRTTAVTAFESMLADESGIYVAWIDNLFTRTNKLLSDLPDISGACFGGHLGVSKELFWSVGGFSPLFDRWGAEDTELGTRFYTAGAVFIPCLRETCIHQGLDGAYGPEGDEVLSVTEQRQLLSNLSPYRQHRDPGSLRIFTVPKIELHLFVSLEPVSQIESAIDSVLKSNTNDFRIVVDTETGNMGKDHLVRRYRSDPRVCFVDVDTESEAQPAAAYYMVMAPFIQFSALSLLTIIDFVETMDYGGLVVMDDCCSVPVVTLFQQRAKNRALHSIHAMEELAERIDGLFGIARAESADFGVKVIKNAHIFPPYLPESGDLDTIVDPDFFFEPDIAVVVEFLTSSDQGHGDEYVNNSPRTGEMAAGTVLPRVAFDKCPHTVSEESQDSIYLCWPFDPGLFNPVHEMFPTGESKFAIAIFTPNSLALETLKRFFLDKDIRCVIYLPAGQSSIFRCRTKNLETGTLPEDDFSRISVLKKYRVILDHHAFHDSPGKRARWIAKLCASGTGCYLLDSGETLRPFLSPEFLGSLQSINLADLLAPDSRRIVVHQTSRASLRYHSLPGFKQHYLSVLGIKNQQFPLISIVVVTKRPENLAHLLHQVVAQSYPRFELNLVCHGVRDEFEQALMDIALPNLSNISFLESTCNLGQCLNAATAMSTGMYVTKMDDDDWYYSEHLYDLYLAHCYSGADLIGKGAEFIYLSSSDLTIQRSIQPRQGFVSSVLSGATLFLKRRYLDFVNGWNNVENEVDRLMIDDVLKLGGKIYRCDSLGFVVHRHGNKHTWNVNDSFFMKGLVKSSHGLDLNMAGFNSEGGVRHVRQPVENNIYAELSSLYYWGGGHTAGNFGDMCAYMIFLQLSGRLPEYYDIADDRNNGEHFVTVGSILNKANSKSIIWGTGIISEEDNITPPAKVLCVRGPKTKARLSALGIECPERFGDPALLLPQIYQPAFNKRYRLGIISHVADSDFFNEKYCKDDEILVINLKTPKDEVFKIIDQIASCEYTLSSSLHGLIVSHSYKVPSLWIKNNDLAGDDVKFDDYFSSVYSTEYRPVVHDLDIGSISIESAVELFWNYRFPDLIDLRRSDLMDTCPFKC